MKAVDTTPLTLATVPYIIVLYLNGAAHIPEQVWLPRQTVRRDRSNRNLHCYTHERHVLGSTKNNGYVERKVGECTWRCGAYVVKFVWQAHISGQFFSRTSIASRFNPMQT